MVELFVLWFPCSWCFCGFGGVTGVPGDSWALGVVVLVVLLVLRCGCWLSCGY